MTLTTLVIGARAAVREVAIEAAIKAAMDASLDPTARTVSILEGMATGIEQLEPLAAQGRVQINRIAPGCMCCVGNLPLRVTLNRILRAPPQRLFISLADSTHLIQIRAFLSQAPYDAFLTLTDTLDCNTGA